ncbi:MAG: hypothetical protein WCH76_02195 [Candidatus Riflemargulisbacteria bacterium]
MKPKIIAVRDIFQVEIRGKIVSIEFSSKKSYEICWFDYITKAIRVDLGYKNGRECRKYVIEAINEKLKEKDYFLVADDVQRFILHKIHVFYLKPLEKYIREIITSTLNKIELAGEEVALTQNRRSAGGKNGGQLSDRGELIRFEILLRMPTEFSDDCMAQRRDMEIFTGSKAIEPRGRRRFTFMLHSSPLDFDDITKGFKNDFFLRHHKKGDVDILGEKIKYYMEKSSVHGIAMFFACTKGDFDFLIEDLTREVNRLARENN